MVGVVLICLELETRTDVSGLASGTHTVCPPASTGWRALLQDHDTWAYGLYWPHFCIHASFHSSFPTASVETMPWAAQPITQQQEEGKVGIRAA